MLDALLGTRKGLRVMAVLLVFGLLGCSPQGPSSTPESKKPPLTPGEAAEHPGDPAGPVAATLPSSSEHRIGVRAGTRGAEFYDLGCVAPLLPE